MSSYRKKKGLYPRDKGFRKDDRFIIVACDDTHAPYQYFGFFELPRVRLLILPPHATKSAARHVLDNLLDYAEEDYDERWLLLDVDHYDQGRHVAGYVATIREAQNKGIRVAISKPFEHVNHRAREIYQPEPYRGRVVVFRAAERPHWPGVRFDDPELGWGPLSLGGIEVRPVPGDHITLLHPPHVPSLARSLREVLDEE